MKKTRRIWLERFRASPFYLALDPESGAARKRYRLVRPARSGWYDEIDGVRYALYRASGRTILQIGERRIDFDQIVRCERTEVGPERYHLVVATPEGVVHDVVYDVPFTRLMPDRLSTTRPEFQRDARPRA